MQVTHPLFLLLLLPLAVAVTLSARARLGRLPWLRALVTVLLRLALCGLLVFALADPSLTRAASGVHVVFVIDRSAGVGAAGNATADAWVRDALRRKHADDSAAVVAFGGNSAWAEVNGSTSPALPAVNPGQDNPQSALQLALAGLPSNQPSRLVLLSDGRQTKGDALLAAQEAAGSGVPISVVPLGRRDPNDVAVTTAELPATARAGDHLTLRAGIDAGRPITATVALWHDDTLMGTRSLALKAGPNSFLFAVSAGTAGSHRYHLAVQAPGDDIPQNNSLDAVVEVTGAPRVLVLAANLTEAAAVVATLAAAGEQVTLLPAAQAPTTAGDFGAYSAVVLADLPASALKPAAVAALRAAVHDQGEGLLVMGGPRSFATGGYANSPMETLLPVTSLSDARASRGNVGLILIIDKSGSMMDAVQGVTKISMAQQAAVDAIAHLQPEDEFGVLAFDDTTHVVAPFGPVGNGANQARTRAAILNMQPFGDTVIYPALQQAARDLFASHAQFKHIVLMTDGQGETAPFLKLIGLMAKNHITLSTIAIGTDAEVDELQSWANTGGGRFYHAADPHDIPRLVVLETRISSGPTRVQGNVTVRQGVDNPALRSLAGHALPPLNAYNITAPRASAQVVLQSSLGDPILTQWRDGLGQVAAWTGGVSTSWARNWLGQTAFWADLTRGLMLPTASRLLQPDLAVQNGVLQIGAEAYDAQGNFANLLATRARVTAPDGQAFTLPLIQDAPGQYNARIDGPEAGVYTVHIEQYDNSAILGQADAAIAVPYPAAYRPGPPDLALLGAIAATGNAPTLNSPSDAFSNSGLPTRPIRQPVWPLLALLALLLFPIDVAARVLYTPAVPYDPARFRTGA
ncbi:MAG TPA: VWA domain-containing protein [Chloroflexota bacterium]|nr:VWA domain-containing protein [Chloroflexota bacterium]